ncbi:MAG: acetate--CoA ligase family protein [Rhizobiaceae bacterium]
MNSHLKPHPATAPEVSLDRLLNARSVAVIGASADPSKIGGKPVALLKQHFGGAVFPVNPNRSEISGLRTVSDIASLDGSVDLALIAVAAAAVEPAVDACLEKGVGSILLFTAGFGEIDEAGRRTQQRIAEKCAARGVRLLGPNSLGFINFHAGLYATFSSALDNVWPKKGSVGIASQSGAVGSYIMALVAEAGIGISHFIATGNEADIDVADCIDWLARDADTRVIVAYLEGCRDGGRLVAALDAARRAGKPVIAIKPGATESGAAAVRSHTGMLAGSKVVFDAVLRAHGAWPAQRIDEAVDLAYACSLGRVPGGSEAAVITPSGGVGIMIADAAEEAGIALPPLPSEARRAIEAMLPLASTLNPIDTTAQVANDFSMFGRVVEIVARQDGFPILFVFMAHMGKTDAVTSLLSPILRSVAEAAGERTIVLITRASTEFRDDMTRAGMMVFEDPHRAVAAVAGLRFFAASTSPSPEAQGSGGAAKLSADAVRELAAGTDAAAGLLDILGITAPPTRLARDKAAALQCAEEFGYPVVLKIDSPDIQHKTEVGGVALGIADGVELAAAWDRMMSSVSASAPSARINGATVSAMITDGVETIIGTRNDPVFGPVIMFGLGGTAAEALKDVVFMPCPVSRAQALEMVGSIKARALLEGWRGAPPADREALAQAITAVSEFAAANRDSVESIEINPFLARARGGVALDILVQAK